MVKMRVMTHQFQPPDPSPLQHRAQAAISEPPPASTPRWNPWLSFLSLSCLCLYRYQEAQGQAVCRERGRGTRRWSENRPGGDDALVESELAGPSEPVEVLPWPTSRADSPRSCLRADAKHACPGRQRCQSLVPSPRCEGVCEKGGALDVEGPVLALTSLHI